MRVDLLEHQDHALELLIYTKNTRLKSELSFADICAWPAEKKLEHLEYMKKTIQSSFEFVRYIIEITGVSRSFTHQLVRTRDAVYAQESMRTVNVSDAGFYNPACSRGIESSNRIAMSTYSAAINSGISVQDARECLPTGVQTSIIFSTHLRELARMAEVRLCTRTSGEYQDVFLKIKTLIANVHPMFDDMLEVHCVKTGICCFPNYTECPVQEHTVKISDERKKIIKDAWTNTDHIANPKVTKPGMTM